MLLAFPRHFQVLEPEYVALQSLRRRLEELNRIGSPDEASQRIRRRATTALFAFGEKRRADRRARASGPPLVIVEE